MNPTNLTRISPNLDPGLGSQREPTKSKFGHWRHNLTQNQVQIGFIWGYQVHNRVEPEFEPYLRSTDWTHFFTLRANFNELINTKSNMGNDFKFGWIISH